MAGESPSQALQVWYGFMFLFKSFKAKVQICFCALWYCPVITTDEPFSRQCPISMPPENVRKPLVHLNLWFSDVFREYRNGTLA